MNILQVGTGAIKIPPQRYGGTELHIFNVSRHMVKMGHRVTVLDIKESTNGPDVENIDGIRFIRLPARKLQIQSRSFMFSYLLTRINTLAFALKVSRHIRKNDFDIIHISGTLIGLVLTFLNRGAKGKMVYSAYSPIWFMPSLGRLDRLAQAADYYLMRRVKKVIVQAEPLRQRLITMGKLKAENIGIIHTAVATNEFGTNIDVSEIVRRYGLNGRITILFNGRIVPYKGVEYLVKAAGIVVNNFGCKEALFLLVGPLAEHELDKVAYGDYIGNIFRLIKEANLGENIKFTGAVPFADLAKLFSACDIFVLPSLAESSPLVIAQAMASAKPVIGTRVGGIPDQIKDGWNGFLVEPANEKELAEKIKYLLDHPEERQRMGLNSRKLAEDEFDWSRIAEQTVKVYEEIVGKAE